MLYGVRKKKIRQEVSKEYNWYGSMALPIEIDHPRVHARVQSLRSRLLEDSILRVDAGIRVFIVGDAAEGAVWKAHKAAIKRINKDVETTTFIRLPNVETTRDIKSVRHNVTVDKVNFRGDRASVIGSMTLKVTYLSPVVLEGTVVEFPGGSPVREARVSIKDIDSGKIIASTTTGPDGSYAFAEIEPGAFMVEVDADGFQKEERVAVVMLKDNVDFTLHRSLEADTGVNLKELKENHNTE